jgi:hypothetical protein
VSSSLWRGIEAGSLLAVSAGFVYAGLTDETGKRAASKLAKTGFGK